MRRRTALLALFVLLAPLASPEETGGGPRIRVEPESFDFGRVLPRRMLRKEFRLRNMGGQPLVIEHISKSCGCTSVTTDVEKLAAGESTALMVTIETRATPGKVLYRVLVRSNDAETPVLEVPLRATIVDRE